MKPNPAPRFTALVFLAILLCGVWQASLALRSPDASSRLENTATWPEFLAGHTAEAVNHVMAHDLPADPWLRAAGGLWRWRLFASGGPQVRFGCHDTLFLTEELRPWPDADRAIARRLDALAARTKSLAQRGITLTIALVPDKSRIAAAELCGITRSRQADQRLTSIRTAAAQRSLALIDLSTILRPEDFLRTDTHWTPQGAARAAFAIAQATQNLPASAFASGPATPYWGDLIRLTSLDALPPRLRPGPDQLATIQYPKPETSGGLLDDDAPAPNIVLIGTSFSRNGQFDRALEAAFRQPVLNVARDGGGFAEAARRYFASPAYRDTKPRQIIWEIPERVLPQPISPDEASFLDSPD